MSDEGLMDKIVSLAKRRGFIYQGSEIYGGLAGTWDYGPHGVLLKENLKRSWWRHFVAARPDVYGIDAAILMNAKAWTASGHVEGFTDPLVVCTKCKRQYRADQLDGSACPECAGEITDAREFNMMFETKIGAAKDSTSVTYLRPETAGGIFVNFKNIIDTFHPELPFGIAQIGKAFRNEIAPRDFIFRVRELEQMEVEWFCREEEWKKWFTYWQDTMWSWIEDIGLLKKNIHELEVPEDELAHYSKRTIDFEYDFPFGRSELYGLAYRTDHDLKAHAEVSGVDLSYYDRKNNEHFIPHVIEPSLGIERTVLALLLDAYHEEEVDGDTRVVLQFKPHIAPVQVAILPLMRKEKLAARAKEVYEKMRDSFICQYDATGSIGKRYRRQDEIGTPYCLTIDFDTLDDDAVTIRDRDSMEQERIATTDVALYITEKLKQ